MFIDSKAEPIIPRRHRKNVKNLRHQTLLRRDTRDGRRSHDDQNEVSRPYNNSPRNIEIKMNLYHISRGYKPWL
jgi:hypothetical protein